VKTSDDRFDPGIALVQAAIVLILGALLALVIAGCKPTALYVEGEHGWGEIDGENGKVGGYDEDWQALVVGLSWQLAPMRVVAERPERTPQVDGLVPAPGKGCSVESADLSADVSKNVATSDEPTPDRYWSPWISIPMAVIGLAGIAWAMWPRRKTVTVVHKKSGGRK